MRKIYIKALMNERGISIIGTIFTLIILGVLGTALVAMVSMDQESRMRSIKREYSFYAVQAGFEYALREIKEGGYPLAQNKALDDASFTNALDCASRKITVVGSSDDTSKTHSITTSQVSSDCLTINTAGASVGGASGNEIHGLVLTKTCLNAVTVDQITLVWTPEAGETVRLVRIGGVDVYDDFTGVASGVPVDITDTKITGSSSIDYIRFSSGISGTSVTMTCTMSDSCTKSATFNLP
ncbi:MAG: hypothetical protein HN337_07440 [Deltaproteobacteria bacterium]|jgi:hypothetical protein|nr:hypothetical protein [Deltaproteobacteria bacterium]